MSLITEAIKETPATLSENLSVGLVLEVLGRSDWRVYSSSQGRTDLDYLISQFVKHHAKVPSLLTRETLALIPLEVLRCDMYNIHVDGWLYLNGAVIVVDTVSGEIVNLFVAEQTASAHNYPDDHLPTSPSDEGSTEDA